MLKYIFFLIALLIPSICVGQSLKKVLVIGIDGCRPDALEVANSPNMDKLISHGIYSPDALNDDITVSGPGWSAILCGVWSDKHLVTNNSFNGSDFDNYPPFFKYINDHDSALTTLSICHWSPINDYIILDHADTKINVSSDAAVATEAIRHIIQADPDVIFLHFDDVDHAGHGHGYSPNIQPYVAAIEQVDIHVGAVIQAVQQRPNISVEDWLILVTTDHGGIGNGHGGNSFDEKNIFMIVSGDNIESDIIFKDSTIIIAEVENCLGDSTELTFDGNDDHIKIAPDSIFDFGTNTDFTIECRVRTGHSGDVAIIGNKNWTSGVNKGVVISFKYPSGPQWKVNIGDGTNRADINNGGEIADNEWHTLSVSFDRDGLMKMYQDGSILDSLDISNIGDINTGQGLVFGTDINNEFDFTGAIAEVRIWNTLVNDQEIKEWHCSSLEASHPNHDNLIGYWKMNESNNNEVQDYSTYQNHSIIHGAIYDSPDTMVVYDFSSTPRQTDVLPTVLTHLCIPLNTDWGLAGHSLIPDCITTHTSKLAQGDNESDFKLFPNPTNGQVKVILDNISTAEPIQLIVYNAMGEMIHKKTTSGKEVLINITDFKAGVYFINIQFENNRTITKKLIVSSLPF